MFFVRLGNNACLFVRGTEYRERPTLVRQSIGRSTARPSGETVPMLLSLGSSMVWELYVQGPLRAIGQVRCTPLAGKC